MVSICYGPPHLSAIQSKVEELPDDVATPPNMQEDYVKHYEEF